MLLTYDEQKFREHPYVFVESFFMDQQKSLAILAAGVQRSYH